MSRRGDLARVVAGQFLGSLADSALLIAAIWLLMTRHAAAWTVPALRIGFYASFVVMGPFAGALADAFPKRTILVATNLAKAGGCALLASGLHPLAAYALVGLGTAAHSPAKYGILSELMDSGGLVAANAWIEVATVLSMLLGVVLGSVLVAAHSPLFPAGPPTALQIVAAPAALYLVAAACCAVVAARPASDPLALHEPRNLVRQFARANAKLWRDGDARTSLAVTSLFWAAAAALQFIVLRWAMEVLHLDLSGANLLQGAVAVGMVIGAAAAGRWLHAGDGLRTLPLALALGAGLVAMAAVTAVPVAAALLLSIGIAAGLLVVPMNAVLQQRGKDLLHPGQSISVQGFAENALSIVMLAGYGLLLLLDVPVVACVGALGVLVAMAMLLVMARRSPRRLRSS